MEVKAADDSKTVPAARKHATLAVASVALLAAFALAGSAGSVQLPGKKDRKAPTAPANVRVTSATPTTVSLAWEPAADNVAVDGYSVHVDSLHFRVSGTEYTATELECGDSIKVSVVAFDRALNHSRPAPATVSTAACQDMRAPTPPSGFRQAATSEDSVILEWNDSSDDTGVVSYGVYQDQLPLESSAQPTTTLSGLACGETIQVQADALDAQGNRSQRRSAWVQTAPCQAPEASASSTQATPDAIAPSQPTNLSFGSVAESELTLSWSPASDNVGVAAYDVYMNGTKVASVTSTSFTQGGLVCDSLYWFGVEARDAAGNRSPRERAHVTTASCASDTSTTPPTEPPDIAVRSVTPTSVALTWSPSSDDGGVVGYDAYRNGAKMVSVPSTSITHGNLACGTSYWFGVAARDAAGNRSPRARVNATTSACQPTPPPPPPIPPPPPPDDSPPADENPPTQPGNLAVAGATKTSVSLTWEASTDNVGVAAYRVYVNGTGALDPTQPGATVTALACGIALTFEVDAADAAGNRSTRAQVTASTAACADTQAPSVPANVAAASRTATSIALTWSPSTDNVGVTGYGLYRGGSLVGTSATTTGIFSGLTCNTNYTLAVDAVDAAGNRSGKATVMVATTACPDSAAPSSPTGLAASNVTQTSLTLSWNASSDNVGVTGYDVYRNGTKMASGTSTSSSQSGLACGSAYWFGVEAFDAGGNRSPRVSVNATTAACPPPPAPPPPPPSSSIYWRSHRRRGVWRRRCPLGLRVLEYLRVARGQESEHHRDGTAFRGARPERLQPHSSARRDSASGDGGWLLHDRADRLGGR